MSEFGLFKYVAREHNYYYVALPNARVHGSTSTDANQGIIKLIGLGVSTEHWKQQIGSHALRSLCSGIIQIEPTAKTFLAGLDCAFLLDAVRGAFDTDVIQILKSTEAQGLSSDELITSKGLGVIRNGSDHTEEFMSALFVSDRAFGEADTFAVIDLSAVDMSSWEAPVLVTNM